MKRYLFQIVQLPLIKSEQTFSRDDALRHNALTTVTVNNWRWTVQGEVVNSRLNRRRARLRLIGVRRSERPHFAIKERRVKNRTMSWAENRTMSSPPVQSYNWV